MCTTLGLIDKKENLRKIELLELLIVGLIALVQNISIIIFLLRS